MSALIGSTNPAQIGRTSVTSGTKWRSRFWMPCFSVAVEDGQPEQAPFMCEVHDAILEAAERDVAAVIGDRRTHAGLDQLLDGGDGVGVARLEELVRLAAAACVRRHHRRAGHEVLHDGAEDRGLELRPLAVGLGDGDEVRAEEHAADAVDVEQPLGERRFAPPRPCRACRACRSRARSGRAGTSGSPDWAWLRSG